MFMQGFTTSSSTLWAYVLVCTQLALPTMASANCYTDCMATCWSGRSDENVSYCSGTEARCQSECRNSHKAYGAIAYSKREGAFGYSDNWSNQEEAEKNALDGCTENGPGCEIVVWFFDSCAAVAASGETVSWGQDYRENSAKKKALDSCSKEGGANCSVKVSHCSK